VIPTRLPAILLVGLAAIGAVGCSEPEVVIEMTPSTIAGVGEMPGSVQRVDTSSQNADSLVSEAATAVRPADLGLPSLGELVAGNRAIVIGDSIFASTAPRFSGSMCERLNEAGWDVEIDAEP